MFEKGSASPEPIPFLFTSPAKSIIFNLLQAPACLFYFVAVAMNK
jgi:hypothetical protein